MKKNFEEFLWDIKDMLQNKVADHLDVNRLHIKITYVDTDLVFENYPLELEEGEPDWFETYYAFGYRYRESVKNCEYGEEVTMIWQHNEYDNEPFDAILTNEQFNEFLKDLEPGNPIEE